MTARISKPLILALGIVLLPFLLVWGRGHVFYDFDMTFITAPIEDLFARYERAGELPLWAPEIQGGYPLIAISHLGFFYPLHALSRLVLPGVITLNISLALHFLLAAGGIYLLLRHSGFRPTSAAFGAAVFTATGFFVGRLYLTNVILPLAWVPFHLWLLTRWLDNRSWPALLGLSATVALQVLLGQPQAALIGGVMLALWWLASLLTRPIRTLFRAVPLAFAAALAVLLSYAQIQPTLTLVPFSDRGDALPEKELYEFSFPFHHTLSWVFPHAFGYRDDYIGAKNETELSTWLGVTALLCVGIGILHARTLPRRLLLFVILLSASSLLMISGEHSPLYRWLVTEHILDTLAIPARWIYLLLLAFSILAAHGLERFSLLEQRRRTLAIGGGTVAILLLVLFAQAALPTSIRSTVFTTLSAHPIKTALPVVALVAFWFFRERIGSRPAFILVLLAAELVVPNLARNVHVPFLQPFHASRAEAGIRNDHAARAPNSPLSLGDRVFTQRDLSLLPSVKPRWEQLRHLGSDTAYEQLFVSEGAEIHGFTLHVGWGSTPLVDGTLRLEVTDEDSGQRRTVDIDGEQVQRNEPLEISFSPLLETQRHRIRVRVSGRFSGTGPWVLFSRNHEGQDVLREGALSLCTDTCALLDIPDVGRAGPDLGIEPHYPLTDRILLAQEMLAPHIAAGKGMPSSQWLGALQLREIKRYIYSIGDQNESYVAYNPLIQRRREMVNRFNIGYLLGSYTEGRNIGKLENVELIDDYPFVSEQVRLYRNTEAYPRVHFAKTIESINHADGALGLLQSATADTPIPIEDDKQLIDHPLSVGTAVMERYTQRDVIVRTNNSGPGVLILRDTFFPGWTATVNGTPTRIYRADMVFRSVAVPAGEHVVHFHYEPTETLQAITISGWGWVGTLIAGTLLTGVRAWRKRRTA